MSYSLPPLPYAYNALEPHLDEATVRIHHDKHHAGYVNNLNAALTGQDVLLSLPVEKLIGDLNRVPETSRTAVRNNGGGHANHTLYWEIMTPGGADAPSGTLHDAIIHEFGTLESFKEQFNKAGAGRFGSGWAWLSVANGKLLIESTPNQDSPLMDGRTPILGCDVWEHAYYLHYQNRRADYLSAWWNLVNWTEVARRYSAAQG